MKYFLIGLGAALVSVLIAYLANDWSLVYMISGPIGIIALAWGIAAAAGIGSKGKTGRLTSSEKRKESQKRMGKMRNAFMVAIPTLAAALINLVML